MSEKLNKEQQKMVSGGSRFWVFDDGKVLVCYTGEFGANVEPVWRLYDSMDKANQPRGSILAFHQDEVNPIAREMRTSLERNQND